MLHLVLLAAVLVPGTLYAQTPKRFLTGPLVIEDQGSFFIGGVQKVSEHVVRPPSGPGVTPPAQPFVPSPQQITIGQMYVQFQIPQRKSGPGWPVIMVHGSTHTGAALESTPDGREGWYPYFVRKGIATSVVDQSGRGRSGFDQSVLHEAEARIAAGDVKGAAQPCQDTVNAINARRAQKQGTARADYLKLDEMGMLGVTHMMMLDSRSNDIADIMIEWVGKNVKKR